MSTPPRPGMESLTLVLLRRPAEPPDLPDDEQDRIQEAHLAFLDALRKQGVMGAAGPFRDHADETLRGLCVYRTTSSKPAATRPTTRRSKRAPSRPSRSPGGSAPAKST